jgi:hypothetical protein
MSEATADHTNEDHTHEEVSNDATAFLIVKRQDGSFFATADLGEAIKIDRAANRQDMKHGCQDILDIISYSDQSNMTAGLIMEILKPKEEETVAGSIREALDERGIL